jgi:hypothetical protein
VDTRQARSAAQLIFAGHVHQPIGKIRDVTSRSGAPLELDLC